MKPKEAVNYINNVVLEKLGKNLDDKQKSIIEGTWNNENYQHISDTTGVKINTLMRDSGPKLWDLLSIVFGNTIAKKNLIEVVTRYKDLQENDGLQLRNGNAKYISPTVTSSKENTSIEVNLSEGQIKEIISQTLTAIMEKEMGKFCQSLDEGLQKVEKSLDEGLQKIEHKLDTTILNRNKFLLKAKENGSTLESLSKTEPYTQSIVGSLIESIINSEDKNKKDQDWQQLRQIANDSSEAVINGLHKLVTNCQDEGIVRKTIEIVAECGSGIDISIKILHELIDSSHYSPETRFQAVLGLQQIAPEDEKHRQAISQPDIYPLFLQKLQNDLPLEKAEEIGQKA